MNVFDPVDYSVGENRFLLEHLGKPPIVALDMLPSECNPRAVSPILERVYALQEREKYSQGEWVGVEKLKEAIQLYLEKQDRWQADRRRGAPRFPSMHTFDSRRRSFWQGPGSDSGKVRTFINPQGERVKFAVELIPSGEIEWTPEWAEADQPKSGIKNDQVQCRIECLICGHVEKYREDSRGSYNSARARISKHLRNAKDKVEEHRETHTQEFG